MFICIYAGGMPFNGETIPSGKSLGGSESAAYYMAKELARLGHSVLMFTDSREPGRWDGVQYEWVGERSERAPLGERFHFVMNAPYDVLIIQRVPHGFSFPYNSKLNIWWLHDLALYRSYGQVQNSLIHTDVVLTVSEFHRRQVCGVYDLPKDRVVATTNGVDYSVFDKVNAIGYEREPMSLLYTARPERGLENLVAPGGIMERLPECRLYVCTYDHVVQQMVPFYNYLRQCASRLKNVVMLPSLGKAELAVREAQAMLHVYPTTFEDTSCIAALEAQAAGTPFVSSEIAALPETLRDGGAVLLPLRKKKVDPQLFADTVRSLLADKVRWKSLHEKALAKRQPWEDAARQWDSLFRERLAAKSSDPDRLKAHLEHYSDVVAADKAGFDLGDKYRFYYQNDYAAHYERYYEYEKNRGVNYGPESLDGNARFESVCNAVGKMLGEKKELRILDYGCAHGHYVMNLRRRFPQIKELVGEDISQSNIDIAEKWAKDDKADNVRFYCGEAGKNKLGIIDKFDVVMANEVLEHVPDPKGLVEKLMAYLSPDGTMLCTVPYGAWEAIGYKQHPGWRAHIHHLERADLLEMFGRQKDYRLLAIPGGYQLGHYLFTFRKSDEPLGEIDYARKLREQAPRETLSVCIIAKDAEHTLGKTLKQVSEIADEIIVGIDDTTTDGTFALAGKFGAKCLAIPSPLKIGFDEARNHTVSLATKDWIMWIDADESLEHPENLHKYLRQNCFDGYAIPQHHVGVEPLGVSKTDLPCRLFRNRLGIRFFGMVHEHPEREMNKGISGEGHSNDGGRAAVAVLPDVSILHTGYSTERIRRERFNRNFPLMQQDVKKYPTRILGRTLWLRDLGHLIQYTMERNGGQVTDEVTGMAVEIIEMWRWLVKNKHLRHAVESLPYYSRAVSVLGGGVEFAFNCAASRMNGGAKLDGNTIHGLFSDLADIKNLVSAVTNDRTEILAKKYF
jgi:2-polyprenyl-3-methyl-5-hydroxy-6-metoxy-1,4-benzoquinol methylase/glycosyltransferase involved in cell wall biosynthesis